MRKVLLAAFLIAVAGASQVGAEGCYVDPDTGIETCPCTPTTVTIIDSESGSCASGHFENSCTGEVTGYWMSCDGGWRAAPSEGCYVDPTGIETCPPGCQPYTTSSIICFGDGISDCYRATTTHFCDGSTYTSWGGGTYYTYLSSNVDPCQYVSGDYLMTHRTNGVADQWYVIPQEDPNAIADFSGQPGWALDGQVGPC